jgi:hypothetical protein
MALTVFLSCLLAFSGADFFPEAPQNEADAALQEEIERLIARPVDLNRATLEQLLAIPWLNPILAQRIIVTRDSLGGFESTAQLRFVQGISGEQLASLVPVVTLSRGVRQWAGSVLLRGRSDSVAGGRERWSTFARAALENGPWQATALIEKDRFERNIFDHAAGGLVFSRRSVRVALGDYAFGLGRGLVFSAPFARSGIRLSDELQAASCVRPVSSASEESGLRGAAGEAAAGRFRFGGLFSIAGRDARLNSDGTVERIVGGGIHDDSAALAEKHQLTEVTSALTVSCRWKRATLAATGSDIRYDRSFGPRDSAGSFPGRELTNVGISADAEVGDYHVGLEIARASTGGMAGALEIAGGWPGVTAGVNLRGYSRRYFAPHGRWTGMTGGQDRLDLSGRLRFRTGGLGIGCQGNTYRDFELDSLPARIDGVLSQRLGPAEVELGLGRSYKAEEERYRTGRLELNAGWQNVGRVVLTLADQYPESRDGRGRMAAVAVQSDRRWLALSLAAARFDIVGSGITMYLHEPGAMRVGASYSAGRSVWRTSAGAGVGLGRRGRMGLKVGCGRAETPVLDAAAQLDIVLGP